MPLGTDPLWSGSVERQSRIRISVKFTKLESPAAEAGRFFRKSKEVRKGRQVEGEVRSDGPM